MDPGHSSSAAENTRVVLDFLEALRAGDRERARGSLAEDATWTYPPSLGGPGVHRGRERIFDVYFATDERLYETGTRSYDLEVTGATAEGERVALELRHRARTRDGRPYETDYHVLYVVRDGRIREVREYFDSLYVRRMYSDEDLGVGA
jgi:ketosteroid isomerase-like protein